MTQLRERRGDAPTGLRFLTRHDLPADTRERVVGLLNGTLADTTDLHTQAKFAHWNVKGQNFYQLHLLFDELAETLLEHQDLVAERATALGGQALGTVRMAADNSTIPELPADTVTGEEYVQALANNVAVHAANLRRDIDAADEFGDEDTLDLYVEISRDVDKYLWFLDAHLQVRPEGAGNHSAPTTESQTAGMQASRGDQEHPHVPIRPSGGQRYGRRSAGDTGAPANPRRPAEARSDRR